MLPVVAVLLLSGCNQSVKATKRPAESTRAASARTQVERGPVRVTVEVQPSPARLSDEPTMTLTIEAESGVEVEKPPFGEAVGDFLIRNFREPLPEFAGDREITRQIYTLEPSRTGALQVDPIVVHFVDKRPQGDGRQHSVETEAVTIQVLSVVKDAPSLADLKGLEPPRELPGEPLLWPWFALTVLGAALISGVIWYRRRRAKLSAPEPLSPRQQAHRELEELWRSDVARHDVKQFYVELTSIVRRYIERTTGIRAPDQTTEEFLREIGGSDRFSREERQKLRDFLESADLVKFAAHRPVPSDIEESYRRARLFVGVNMQEAAA
jgi:hypothetical protein